MQTIVQNIENIFEITQHINSSIIFFSNDKDMYDIYPLLKQRDFNVVFNDDETDMYHKILLFNVMLAPYTIYTKHDVQNKLIMCFDEMSFNQCCLIYPNVEEVHKLYLQ